MKRIMKMIMTVIMAFRAPQSFIISSYFYHDDRDKSMKKLMKWIMKSIMEMIMTFCALIYIIISSYLIT